MYTHIIATQDATLWKQEKCFCAPVLTLASVLYVCPVSYQDDWPKTAQ